MGYKAKFQKQGGRWAGKPPRYAVAGEYDKAVIGTHHHSNAGATSDGWQTD